MKSTHRHCRATLSNVLLIVAHWKGHLAHLEHQPFCYLVIEKAFVGRSPTNVLEYGGIPNRANEASSYLSFLVNHYHSLPEHMIFLQDEQASKHNRDILTMLRHLHLDAAPYIPLNNVHLPFVDPRAFCHVKSCVADSGLRRYIRADLLPSSPYGISYTCCAQFAVTRTAVHTHPRALYADLYNYTQAGADFGHRGDSFARGECMEVLWHIIFGQPRISASMPSWIKCGPGMQATKTCRTRSGLSSFVPINDSFWSWAAPTWTSLSLSERMHLRQGHGSLFEVAARSGRLCLGAMRDDRIVSPKLCSISSNETIARAVQSMEEGEVEVFALRGTIAGSWRNLTHNCDLLAKRYASPVGRRKFTRTLRKMCDCEDSHNGKQGTTDRVQRPLHEKALCVLFDASAWCGQANTKNGIRTRAFLQALWRTLGQVGH